ncbi:hypothetical protein K413DRAFT_1260 [Clostridium sp. ASBs410]|nr:hypothetical protein K413DRAFT_1260 [Clostridium sp. ASBs410]
MEEERKEVNGKIETESNKNAKAAKKKQSEKKSLGQKILEIDEEEFGEKVEVKLNGFADFIQKILKFDIRTPEGRKKGKERLGILGSAIATILLGMLLSGNFSNAGKEYMQMVKTGTPNGYEKISYEDAFGMAFKDMKWEYIGENDNNPIVQFNGDLKSAERITVCIQFAINVDTNTFSMVYMDINGQPTTLLEMSNEVNDILNYAYRQKGYATQQSYNSNGGEIEELYDQIFSGVEDAMVDSYVNAANNNNQQVKVPETITQTEPNTIEYVPNGTYTDAYNFAAFDETYQSAWYSYDADCFMSAYVNEGEPIIEFSNSVTDDHSTVIYYALPISIQLKDNGGFEYLGEVHEANSNDFVGDIHVVWESGMDYNKPYVEIKDGNENFRHSIAGVYEIQ